MNGSIGNKLPPRYQQLRLGALPGVEHRRVLRPDASESTTSQPIIHSRDRVSKIKAAGDKFVDLDGRSERTRRIRQLKIESRQMVGTARSLVPLRTLTGGRNESVHSG